MEEVIKPLYTSKKQIRRKTLDPTFLEYTSKFARKYGINIIVSKIKESEEYKSGLRFKFRDISKRVLHEYLSEEQQYKLVANNDGSFKYTFEDVAKHYAAVYARNTPTEFIDLSQGFFRAAFEGEIEDQLEEEISDEETNAGFIYAFTYKIYMREDEYPIKIGKTVNDVEKRVSDQFKGSAMPEPPYILGKWYSAEFNHLERALHAVLKVRGKWIIGASGIEWFRSSLDEIQEIIDFIEKNKIPKL